MTVIEKLKETKEFISQHVKIQLIRGQPPEIGIVLGSGLGKVAESIPDATKIPYSDIPHFVKSTVEGHRGELVCGKLFGKNVIIMCGRLHFYEGYTMQEITYPIRVMTFLGIKTLILTSAVGAINKNYRPGDIVFVTDHINFMGDNPLRGLHEAQFGERFPDMTEVYDRNLIDLAVKIAKRQKLTAHRGVYIACRGPSYETPSEIKMARILGADVVGMSVVPEAIVAHQGRGVKLLCIAYVSNMAAGVSKKPLSHKEVIETGRAVSDKLISLLNELIEEI
ncbi:MAG: purine-nucleoside phosphorylase [Elusimicrobiota bacterium]|nr:purine-nucleoside phosphorylase [Elusimicrobiota bacterium]